MSPEHKSAVQMALGWASRAHKCSLPHSQGTGLWESPSRAAHHSGSADRSEQETQIREKNGNFDYENWWKKICPKCYFSKIIATREFRLNLIKGSPEFRLNLIKLFWLQIVINFFPIEKNSIAKYLILLNIKYLILSCKIFNSILF